MLPFFQHQPVWVYPLYGGIGASFGYWLQGVEDRQIKYLQETKQRLLDKRARRAERESINSGNAEQKTKDGMFASPTA